MDFLIHPMEPVASKQNLTTPSMKNFLCIMRMMEMVPSVKPFVSEAEISICGA